jgi:hypothetical protein
MPIDLIGMPMVPDADCRCFILLLILPDLMLQNRNSKTIDFWAIKAKMA